MCYSYPCICPPSTYDYLCTPTWGSSTTYYSFAPTPSRRSSRYFSVYPDNRDHSDDDYPGYTDGYSVGIRRAGGGRFSSSSRRRSRSSSTPEYLSPTMAASVRSTGATAGSSFSSRSSRHSGYDDYYYASGDRSTTRIRTSDDEVNVNVRFSNNNGGSRRSCSPATSSSSSSWSSVPTTRSRRRVRVSLY
ncbi:hypothetical protein SBRCBS47491_007412 [Sporothrix bragantina]|uniref:Uncharacterized protein n=1 Tax=Sporothrix bragantina TaxID=671064 RepID=A0ABP0CD07_9PEZI